MDNHETPAQTPPKRRPKRTKFLLAVGTLALLGSVALFAEPLFYGRVISCRVSAHQSQIGNFGAALDMFALDIGRYPTTEEGLDALRDRPAGLERWDGPYIKKDIPKDPWGNAYVYKGLDIHRTRDGGDAYILGSYGADGIAGGTEENADVGWPPNRPALIR